LESLSCDIPPLPTESRLWRGNETHELMLPITVSRLQHDCPFVCSRPQIVNRRSGSQRVTDKNAFSSHYDC
jgi:hypothetical protein